VTNVIAQFVIGLMILLIILSAIGILVVMHQNRALHYIPGVLALIAICYLVGRLALYLH
jgi:hypothetical protein